MAKTWKQRLVKEAAKLNAKLEELSSYLEGNHGEFDKLDEPDRDLLITQHAAMTTYSNVMEMRMKRYGLIDAEECDECQKAKKKINEMIQGIFQNMRVELDEIDKDDDGRNS